MIKKGIIKKILLVCFIAAVIAGVLFFVNTRGLGLGSGNGLISSEEEVISDILEQEETTIPPLLLIEIREDRIYYNDIEVTLSELEAILIANLDDIWEIYDAYRAYRITFENVRELLTRLDIVFRER